MITLYARISSGGDRTGFSLGIQVSPDKFDKDSEEIIGKGAEVIEQNKQLRFVRSELTRHYNLLREKGLQITPAVLKNAYLGVSAESKSMLEAFDIMYELFEKRVEKKKFSAETLRKWKSYRVKLADFIKSEFNVRDLPLDRVRLPFAETFFNYLTLDGDLEDNTAMKYIKNTKQLLTFAEGREWIAKNPLNSYKCSYIDPDRDILDADQLATLYFKEINIPRLQEAKDIYLFMAFTGYAYKDVLNLTTAHVSKYYDRET